MKIILENTTKRALTLHVTGKPVQTISIPAASFNADRKLINGVAEVDDSLLTKARKYAVVQHYFAEGWLREVKSSKEEPKAA